MSDIIISTVDCMLQSSYLYISIKDIYITIVFLYKMYNCICYIYTYIYVCTLVYVCTFSFHLVTSGNS